MSDEKFRQKHFDELTSYYFKCLAETVQTQNSNMFETISRKYADIQVRSLLPIVKFKYASDLAKANPSPHFENILANISNYLKYPLIHQEDVYQATKNKLQSDDYDLITYTLVPLDAKNGHLGEYFHLKISVNFQNQEKKLNLFAKFLLVSTDEMREFLERGVGKKEDFFYCTLYQIYSDHGLENLLDFAPKCYLSKLSGFVILEDLGSLEYIGLKPNAILNYDGLKIILAKVAKYHACTFIVEEILSKKLGKIYRLGNDYAEYLEEVILVYEGPFKNITDRFLDSLYYIVNKFPDITNKISLSTEQLKAKIKEVWFSPFVTVKASDSIRNVVNHGDLYVSNMLFKFGQDQNVKDGILIDFQLLRYVPPAFEILFFIFVSSLKETRDKHLQSLLNWYYENLSGHLTTFNLDPDEIYSRKHFEDDIDNSKSAALAQAFNYGHSIQVDPDFREEVFHDQEKTKYYFEDNKEEFVDLAWEQGHYKIMLRGIIEDIIDLIKK